MVYRVSSRINTKVTEKPSGKRKKKKKENFIKYYPEVRKGNNFNKNETTYNKNNY